MLLLVCDRRRSGSSRRHSIFGLTTEEPVSQQKRRRGGRGMGAAGGDCERTGLPPPAALKATAPLQTLGPDPQSASLMASSLHPGGKVNFQLFSPVSPRQRAHMSPVLIAAAANGGKCVKLSGAGGCSLFALLDLSVR